MEQVYARALIKDIKFTLSAGIYSADNINTKIKKNFCNKSTAGMCLNPIQDGGEL